MARQPASQIGLFSLVTCDAESHLKAFPPDTVHGMNWSMALLTLNILFNVSLMVEQNVFGNIENLFPRRRGLGIKIFVFLLNPRMIGNDVIVTIKTFFNRR